MKALFISSTVFQIFISIYIIKVFNLKADIVITDFKNYKEYKAKLEATGVFNNVYYGNDRRKSFKIMRALHLQIFDDMVYGDFHLNNYNVVFSGDLRKLLKKDSNRFFSFIKHFIKPKQRIIYNLHDEGTMSYLDYYYRWNVESSAKITGIYLFNKNLASYKDTKLFNIIDIPKISLKDRDYINIVNSIFKAEVEIKFSKEDIVFFDQPYINKDIDNVLDKYILPNIKSKGKKFYKLHPRSENKKALYEKHGFIELKVDNCPWEIFLFQGQTLPVHISVTSTAILSPFLYIEDCQKPISIFLYKLVKKYLNSCDDKKGECSPELNEFIQKVKNANEKYIKVIEDIEELKF